MTRGPSVPWPAVALVAAMLFAAWMPLGVLDPRAIGWLLGGGDRGQNSIGLAAYLREGGPWPSLHDPLLMAPEGISVALTDSNPLLALLLRPFAGWLLPAGWQYAGLWLAACILLQVGFAAALIARFVPMRSTALIGTVLLAASPTLFARYGHLNLCAHWLILWALLLFVDDRDGRRWGWIAVTVTGWLIHPYLAVMVAAIWASAQLRLLATGRLRGGALVRTVAVAGITLLMPAALGYVTEPVVPTGTYGDYAMALDALWTPGDPGYSALIPARAPTAEQGYEGMNYAGAGGIALFLAAAALLAAQARGRDRPADDAARASPRILCWLLPIFALLAVLAVGPHVVWRGRVVLYLGYPAWLIAALDPVRAGGRLFWPAGYALMLAAIGVVGRTRHARVLLLGALVLQIADVAPMLAIIRQDSRDADGRAFGRTRDPRWSRLIADAGAIDFIPHRPYRDMAVLEEVAWRALAACRPVPLAWFYASREPRAVHARTEADAAAFARGDVDPRRLVVILEGAVPPPLAARAIALDGVAVIPPALPRPPDRGVVQQFLGNGGARGGAMSNDCHHPDAGRTGA